MRHSHGVVLAVLGVLGLIGAGCGGGGGHGGGGFGPPPSITSINGSANPTSPVNQTIEITGTNFGNSGTVHFTQGNNTTVVSPVGSGSYSNSDILVTVPGTLATPGSVSVTVFPSSGGSSNAVNLNLVVAPSFSPSNQVWTTATSLPTPLRAHQATSVTVSTQQAWLFVVGGNNGVANVSTVLVAGFNNAGVVGTWGPTNPLPATRAFAAVTEADSTNSRIPVGQAAIYCIGGQQAASDAPGGTNSVFIGTVNLASGAVTWTTNANSLPETRVGAKAAVSNGFIYVTGGLNSAGQPISAVASAPINSDGTIGAWNESSNQPLPSTVVAAFHETFAFGGFLYVIAGDAATSTTPFANTLPTGNTTAFAPIRQGVVGTWSATSGQPGKNRSKFALVQSFGQVAIYEGLYSGSAGSSEGQVTAVQANGDLGSFNGLTGSNTPSLNTYNTAGVATQLVTSGTPSKPVWVLIAGDNPSSPGNPTATVKSGP